MSLRLKDLLHNVAALVGNLVLYPLSKLYPRNDRLWAFGAADGRFDGNAKYLFLWLSLNKRDVSAVWITPNRNLVRELQRRGLPCFHRWSLRGMATGARAGFYLVNDNGSDVNFSVSGGTKIFNLWHGVGLKNVLYGAKVGEGASRRRAMETNSVVKIRNMRRFERPSLVLATSCEMAEKFFARCFAVPVSRALPFGYPRLDPCLDENLKLLGKSFGTLDFEANGGNDKKKILYVPTLRGRPGDLLSAAIPDINALSAALQTQNAELTIKFHPKMRQVPKWRLLEVDNIHVLANDVDIYDLLDEFDACITDYSSLFFDYIFFRSKGVALYTFDYDLYTGVERDLAWDYDEATVGVRINDFRSLCNVIATGKIFADLDPARLATLRQRFWDGDPRLPTASEKITDYLLAQL